MYCIYLRKSRADEELELKGEQETLARHESMLISLAKKMNLTVTKIHKEIVSGETISSRPVMQQLLSEVEQGLWKGVLVVEVERLARGDTMDQGLVAQTFKYSGTKIISPVKTYDPGNEFDEEYFEFGLFMSRREYKTINRRLQRGRLQSAMEGKYVGNKAPYGYQRVKLVGQKGFTLEPHPEQAPVVKLIYGLYINGWGIQLIIRKLTELKIPTITGGAWSMSTLRGILSNPVYIGKIRWLYRAQVKKMTNGEITKERPRANSDDYHIFDGLHQAIVSDDDFYKAQKLLAENKSVPAPKNRGVKNPMAGVIICGRCGRNMVRRPYGGKYPDTIMCPDPTCDNISSLLTLVEEKLLQALNIWLDRYEVKIAANEKGKDETMVMEQAIVKLEKEIETLEKQEGKLHDLLEQGVYTIDVFLKRSTTLGGKLSAARGSLEQLKKEMEKVTDAENSKEKVVPAIRKVVEVYHQLEAPEDKNKLLKSVLEKVTYIKDEKGSRWRGTPDNFKLTLYPKLPK